MSLDGRATKRRAAAVTSITVGAALVGALLTASPATAAPDRSAAAAATASADPAVPAAVLPDSMAVIGDSLSQGFDACCFWGARPQHSWATGSEATDGIQSHYERLLAANPAIEGHAHNFANLGAHMADGPAQARQAVAAGAEYVAILIGGNDACTDTTAAMTLPEVFRAQFERTMATLDGLPDGARVFVASVPNIPHLASVFGDNPLAQAVWALAGLCPSTLRLGSTAADRAAVTQRISAYNEILAEVCERYWFCRHDRGATFAYRFAAEQITTLDFFHPSRTGQAALARLTWQWSWWPALDGTSIQAPAQT